MKIETILSFSAAVAFTGFASIVASSQALAAGRLVCNVSEDVNPPLQERSKQYVLESPLGDPNDFARIGGRAETLGVSYGFETFKDSGGRQIVLIGVNRGEIASTAYGQDAANVFEDVAAGTLAVECAVR